MDLKIGVQDLARALVRPQGIVAKKWYRASVRSGAQRADD